MRVVGLRSAQKTKQMPLGMPGKFCTSRCETNWYARSLEWQAERSVCRSNLCACFDRGEVGVANGETIPAACREGGIAEQR